jgi:hypothetical protein
VSHCVAQCRTVSRSVALCRAVSHCVAQCRAVSRSVAQCCSASFSKNVVVRVNTPQDYIPTPWQAREDINDLKTGSSCKQFYRCRRHKKRVDGHAWPAKL